MFSLTKLNSILCILLESTRVRIVRGSLCQAGKLSLSIYIYISIIHTRDTILGFQMWMTFSSKYNWATRTFIICGIVNCSLVQIKQRLRHSQVAAEFNKILICLGGIQVNLLCKQPHLSLHNRNEHGSCFLGLNLQIKPRHIAQAYWNLNTKIHVDIYTL